MRARSRACRAARARSRRYLRSTRSMKAERECFEPARRSSSARRSFESVIEVFSFIPPLYYHSVELAIDARCSGQGRKDGGWAGGGIESIGKPGHIVSPLVVEVVIQEDGWKQA